MSAGDERSTPVVGVADPASTAARTMHARKFAALRNRDSRTYLFGTGLAMMADNIEHVITYWILWQLFQSEWLVGFQVLSHWLPFLLFSVYFGGLADRFDCRRVIQVGQALFMGVSVAWAVLILTGTLEVWMACVLLVVHGLAGALWGPAEQLMLHDFVGEKDLPSAVRLNATFKSFGILCGPVVGSALLLGLGPVGGLFVNAAIYLPLTLFLFRTRFTGHLRTGIVRKPRVTFRDSLRTLREVASSHTLVSMIVLGALGSFFIGASLQSVMPVFAEQMGTGSDGLAYGVLLFATGAGGVIGGLLLEGTGRIRSNVPSAVVSTLVYGAAILGFAITRNYVVALLLLFVAGVANLAAMSIGQTVVQLLAPPEKRGQVIGLFGMATSGMRFGSGITVGFVGSMVGLHWSLGLSAAALIVGTGLTAIYALRPPSVDAPTS